MIEASVRCSHPEGCLGRRPLGRCGNRVEKEPIILIDVESNSCENVVIIDSPDSLPSKFGRVSARLSRGKKIASSWKDVICLDDDENADGLRSGGTSGDGSSPGKNSSPSNFRSSSAAERYEFQSVQENISPLRLSKGKRTYSGPTTNCFGLADTHDLFSDDFLDSDLMEDSYGGKVKEMWEKANSKRKRKVLDDQPVQGDSDEDGDDRHKNANISTEYRQCEETPCVSKKAEDAAAASSTHKKKEHLDCMSDDSLSAIPDGSEDIFIDSILKEHFADGVNDSNHTQGSMVYGEILMMGDREKHKETDEYKKAMEKELASRQQALRIQAEEAQNLRRLQKRMNAERMRLFDMEQRQKQRVEEIRETQKKREENSNVKEIIRAEVRKDLNKLEVTCHDMASLLRGLGIPVGNGVLPPLLSEVRSAYKRALLSFHPDRASRSDVRQQVEAEEKFKLISRMKEKFLV